MVEYIYYTGIGSKENGMHTVEEFLDIMNKHFNVQCSELKKRKCNLEEYIKFSGAELRHLKC
jgi:demethoxyubiquinone hydroxylase (CLK1/Coq7/Cat5 family)